MQVDGSRVQYLMEVLQRRSGNKAAAKILKNVGIKDLEEPIDVLAEAEFVRLACQELDDLLFAVKAGLDYRYSTTLVGYVARYSRTVEAAIRNSQKISATVYPAYRLVLQVSSNYASLELEAVDERLSKYHRHRDLLIFGVLALLRSITNTQFYPIELRLTHPGGDFASEIEKIAGFPVVFSAEKLEMLLPLSVLDIPIPTYEPKLRDYLIAYGERLLVDNPNQAPSLRARIEGVLTNGLPNRLLPAKEVAATLGMSGRTMARRLEGEGLKFRTIVDDLRLDLSKTYLRDGISVTEVAFLLDYSDTAAFSTAFKRWTELSPRQFVQKAS
ncbi:helix-turn-helix domain-containing protein [Shimia abyssi]|uniref:AraC-like DNA-binding protein n=1 Tax=Shimia abyssi TaxID=1662395 RepID=A0A2P8F2V7_9RHOB|nr:AraC family transcriptional regulator [Shimia abyssi]PSL16057.1 AraC-like DNA-binding protein [Shimia abyssi]